jgi:dihydrofolate synthase / folylpolyglutamate synthase
MMKHVMDTEDAYFKAIDFLEGLVNLPLRGDYMIDSHHADIYLKRMRYFLGLLGDPDKGMKFIHIAGTSGKGTVTSTLHTILHSARKNVGSFTSPSVTTSIEKIKVGDLYIPPDEFAYLVDHLKPFIDKAYINGPYGRPSYFEIFFAIALVYFQKKKCEWVVLEVGLGGRYDATNVIEKPLVSAITNIDYDHTELLGKTLQKIAFDKAGIIKQGSVVYTTEQRTAITRVFENICKEKRVILHRLPKQANYREYNNVLARAIAQHIGIDEVSITRGIQHTRLPCRFEVMQHKPLVILDGAHNRSKIRTTIENLKKLTFDKLHVIIAIADNKDHISILEQIIPEADHIYFTRFQNRNRACSHPKELLVTSKQYVKKRTTSEIFLDAESALRNALQCAGPQDLILVVGSFFLAGELRTYWYPEHVVLKKRTSFW